jgi:quinol monooxygenase YgiN
MKTYLSISHEVADYDSWKLGFDEHKSSRTAAGLKEIFVKQDSSNANSVTAFFEVEDKSKAEAFLSDPDLKEAMTKAGVTTAPRITFSKSAREIGAINSSALVTTVSHSVADYSAWKAVYDSSEELRKNAGSIDYLLLRSIEDENVVTVVGTSSSVENFQEFISNPDLKGAMEQAGVTSKPEVRILA